MTQTLYRFWDKEELLYIGVSVNAYRRASQHGRNAEWWEEADHVTFEKFNTREEVLLAERVAIETEYPKYNVIYNSSTPGAIKQDTPTSRGIWPRHKTSSLQYLTTSSLGYGYTHGPTNLWLEHEVGSSSVFEEFYDDEEVDAWTSFLRHQGFYRSYKGGSYHPEKISMDIYWTLMPLGETAQRTFKVGPTTQAMTGFDIRTSLEGKKFRIPKFEEVVDQGDIPFWSYQHEAGMTYPIDAKNGIRLDPSDLPIFPSEGKSELMYKSCSWKPYRFQKTVTLDIVIDALTPRLKKELDLF